MAKPLDAMGKARFFLGAVGAGEQLPIYTHLLKLCKGRSVHGVLWLLSRSFRPSSSVMCL